MSGQTTRTGKALYIKKFDKVSYLNERIETKRFDAEITRRI